MNTFINERDKYKLNLFSRSASTTMKIWLWYDLHGWHDEFLATPPERDEESRITDLNGDTFRIHEWINRRMAKTHLVGDDYQVFTVVRNPFSRMVSAYYRVIADPDERAKFMRRRKLTDIGSNFAEFLELVYLHNLKNAHWRPQSHLQGETGNLLRFETLQEDFDRMCSLLGKAQGPLPLYNTKKSKGRSKDPADYYTGKTADILRYLYAGDFERFGYSTEMPESV